MIVVLLLCVLAQLQALSRNQNSREPRKSDEKLSACDWPIESHYIVSYLSERMFGYNPMELYNQRPNLYNRNWNSFVRDFWETMESKSIKSSSPRRSFQRSGEFTEFETSGISGEPELKNRLADIFDGLTPQEQDHWSKHFEYAPWIGELAKMRKRNT